MQEILTHILVTPALFLTQTNHIWYQSLLFLKEKFSLIPPPALYVAMPIFHHTHCGSQDNLLYQILHCGVSLPCDNPCKQHCALVCEDMNIQDSLHFLLIIYLCDTEDRACLFCILKENQIPQNGCCDNLYMID